MENFANEVLDTSLANDTPEESKIEKYKTNNTSLEECLNTLDKPENARTQEEIDRITKALMGLGIFDRSSFGNLEPIAFLRKLTPLMKHEIYTQGSAIVHYNCPHEKLCIIVKGKAKEFIPKNAQDLESESRNSLSNGKDERVISKTVSELSEQESALLKQRNTNQPKSLTSIMEENEQEVSPPNRKRRSVKRNKIKTQNSSTISLTALDKPHMIENSESRTTLKTSKSSANTNGTLNNLEEDESNHEFIEEFRKLPKTYFIGEVLKVKFSKILEAGVHWGSKPLGKKNLSKQAVFAAEDCHCISLYKDDLLAALESEKRLHKEKIDFFQKLFPSFNQETVTELALLWDEQTYKRGDIVFHEKSASNLLLVVLQGEITISKDVNDPIMMRRNSDGTGAKKRTIQVATFCQGYFFEEEFFEKKQRMFTATVSSGKAKILQLSREDYRMFSKTYQEIFSKIKEMVKLSNKHNLQRLEGLYQTYNIDVNREVMQEEFLNHKGQALKLERSTLRSTSNLIPMIMKPTKKPKNVNLRLQYDKYFVCKPGQKYPEYLKVVMEGNTRAQPTDNSKDEQISSKGVSVLDSELRRRLSIPAIKNYEVNEESLNFVKPIRPKQNTHTKKDMNDYSKYSLNGYNGFRITVNDSNIQSDRETLADSIFNRNSYFQVSRSRRNSQPRDDQILNTDNEFLAVTSSIVPLHPLDLSNQEKKETNLKESLLFSTKRFSKMMRGLDARYNNKDKSKLQESISSAITSDQSRGISIISSTQKENLKNRVSIESIARSLNNLPCIPLSGLTQAKNFDKPKGPEITNLPSLLSPKRKIYSSLRESLKSLDISGIKREK